MAAVPETNVAIITGAGAGIGRAVSLLLGDHGWRLALVGRTQATLQETRRLLRERASAPDPIIVSADVADPQGVNRIVDEALAAWGRVDALINNAAILRVLPIDRAEPEALAQTFAANVFGPALLVSRLWPTFQRQRGGCVVNVSSLASVDPFPDLAIYASSKAALESLTRSILVEGRALGIRAFSVLPGAVETAMLRSVIPDEQLPPSRTLAPSQVAAVIVDCVLGRRDSDIGRPILLPNP